MKILIITDGISPFVIGGMQKHSFNLARQLALRGHNITLFHCVTGNDKLPESAELLRQFGPETMNHLEVITLRFPKPSWYPGHYLNESYLFSRQIYQRIQERLNEFDFIYAKGFTAWYFLEQKKRGKHLPPIGIKFHGYEMFQPPVGLRMRLENRLLSGPVKWNNRNADFVFSYGGKITSLIKSLGVPDHKIIEVPTGIDPSWITTVERSRSAQPIHCCFIGRNERRKGIVELIEAIKMLPTDDLHFHFIGPIPPVTGIKQSNVTFHGAVRNAAEIQNILDGCRVLVVPSHSEGMPNVIMEGMARGLAIIATPVGAVESVVDDLNGWLIQPGNVQSLANCLASIAEMPETALLEKQTASLQRIMSFTWDNIALRTAEAIEKSRQGT
jgi:glycosyltransferase involved in cell wall biosynthesis